MMHRVENLMMHPLILGTKFVRHAIHIRGTQNENLQIWGSNKLDHGGHTLQDPMDSFLLP
jgi:hypothetical protein